MRRAFGVVEILVVIALLGLIVAIVIVGFRSWQDKAALASAIRDIESVLKLARSKTLASEGGAQYGVQFPDSGTSFSLCKNPYCTFYGGCAFNCGTTVSTHTLPPGIAFCSYPLNGDELNTLTNNFSVNPVVAFAKLEGYFETLDPAAGTEGTVFIYNTRAMSAPCGNAGAIAACLGDGSCGGVTITQDGVIYEREL